MIPKNRQYRKIFTIRMPLCLAEIYLPTHCFGTESLTGRGIHNIAYEVDIKQLVGYFSEDDIEKVGKRGLQKLLDQKFVKRIEKESFAAAKRMLDHSFVIDAQSVGNLTNDALSTLYLRQIDLIRDVYRYFNLSSPAIALALEKEIDRLFLVAHIPSENVMKIKGKFLQSPKQGTPEIEERELKKIAIQIKDVRALERLFNQNGPKKFLAVLRTNFPKYDALIERHRSTYDYLQGYVDFNRFDKIYYIHRLQEFLGQTKKALEEEIKKYENKGRMIIQSRRRLIRQYHLSKPLVYLLDLSSYFAFHRMEMRVHYTRGLVSLRTVLEEIARRMNISTEDVKWLLMRENIRFLKEGSRVAPNIIRERKKLSIYHIENMKMKLKVGKRAVQWRKQYLPLQDFSATTSVKGTIANPGLRRGIVKLIVDPVNIVKEMRGMKLGSILVTRNTRPDMIVACKKATAIVTDEGGILSHAALVSREFGIPCIIATWNATKIFKDGDYVEVDAEKGIVKKLS